MSSVPGRVRLRRSELTTPASSARMIEKAATGAADVVILDLEDATAAGRKEEARGVLVETARRLEWGQRVLAFRPNRVGSRWFEADVREVLEGLGEKMQVMVLPKVDSEQEVMQADLLLSRVEEEAGLPAGCVALEALVESPRAVLALERIAAASPRLEALIFGVADFAASAGMRLGDDVFGDYAYVKQRIVTVARAYGLAPIDCVTFRYQDLELTRADAERAARMGFEGKWCVHPGQVAVVNDAFTPLEREVAWATAVVEGFERAEGEGQGALAVEGQMVDLATVRVARRLLEAHWRAARKDVSGPSRGTP